MDFFSALHDGLSDLNHHALPYLLDLCVISALAMALLQAAKEVFNIRESYNRKHFTEWLGKRLSSTTPGSENKSEYLVKAKKELLRIATDRDEFAFYGGDITDMCRQFSGAATVLLDYPKLSLELFHLLTVNSEKEDVDLVLNAKPMPPVPILRDQALDHADMKRAAVERQYLIDARNRIRHQLTESISSFESTVSTHWQRKMKHWSWAISLLLTFLAGFLAGLLNGNDVAAHVIILLFASAISAFLAPIARDLVAALEGLHP